MMRMPSVALLLGLFAAGTAATARAQTAWTDRGYVNVSGWFQPTASFSGTVRPIDFAEPSVVDTSYKTRSIPGVEVDGGVRLWRNLAVGLGVSRFSKHTDGAVSAQIPHPFFFNRARTVSGDASSLTRDETAVHLQVLWMRPMRDRWRLALAGGPSWFAVGQDLVSDVTVTQAYPYDTATFANATAVHRSRSKIGFNAGADVNYILRTHVALGVGLTYSRATVALDDTLTVDAGGAHIGGGLRFRF
jgi:opacity protein-like surface antigen